MKLANRIEILHQLNRLLDSEKEAIEAIIQQTYYQNRWFTVENTKMALDNIKEYFLNKELLTQWANQYNIPDENPNPQKIGIIMAGNIPLVGFHDFLCTFICGHHAQIKLSSKDQELLKMMVHLMTELEPSIKEQFQFVERIQEVDAIIATGSNNSARYFEAYFGKYPNIIRKNRTSIAVLNGQESEEDIKNLGKDIFQYYGLGCRNVSKIYVPKDFNFENLLNQWDEYESLTENDKYKNNFDYHYTILIMNNKPYMSRKFTVLTESEELASPIAHVYYEYYDDPKELLQKLAQKEEQIQCKISHPNFADDFIPFGQAQKPSLTDYADNVDTMQFLLGLPMRS